MKWKLLLCAAAMIASGCSFNQNQYATYGEYGYSRDLVPQPVPGLTAPEMRVIYGAPVTTPTISSSSPPSDYVPKSIPAKK
jgi:hypothetical protein